MSPKSIRKDFIEVTFNKYIKGTTLKSRVKRFSVKVGKLNTKIDLDIFKLHSGDVYCTSRALKHVYDRRPELCNSIISHLYSICTYPTSIYKNSPGKRGDIIITKELESKLICVVLEETKRNIKPIYEIVTIFVVNEKYLNRKKLLWSEGTATPLS